MKEPIVSLFKDLVEAAKTNGAFDKLNDKELEAMVIVDIARICIDTVATEFKNNKMICDNKFIANESIRLIHQLTDNDLPKKNKENCEKAIRAILRIAKSRIEGQ